MMVGAVKVFTTDAYCAGWIRSPLQQLKPGEGSHACRAREGCGSWGWGWLGNQREAGGKTAAGAEMQEREPTTRSSMLGNGEETGALVLPGDLWSVNSLLRPSVRRGLVGVWELGYPCFPHRARERGAEEGWLGGRQLEEPETRWAGLGPLQGNQ